MEEKIIRTDKDRENGQNKCPKCGSTDISLNSKTGLLRCNFCRFEFKQEKFDQMEEDLSNLEGEVIASGATDIVADADNLITLKCTSCGAEVTIDSSNATQARCHWCRNTLSLNEQVPNGAVPDTLLPFGVSQQEAKAAIQDFVGKRRTFAHPQFKKEFSTDNVMGVYLPYLIVDANAHADYKGQGEIETRRWTEKVGDTKKTYYNADLYDISRSFDITIEGLTIESSQDKLDRSGSTKTNNIINSIMPFDTENCIKWDPNYMRGYTLEKRDVNVDGIKPLVQMQCEDIARYKANDTVRQYDRGVRWDKENLEVKGRQWKAAYFPVWLYSYLEKKGDENLLHYVAVNARTKETMGSVPIHKPKLLLVSFIIELFALAAAIFTYFWVLEQDSWYPWALLVAGFMYYGFIYSKYRNTGERHFHELETHCDMTNLVTHDEYVKELKRCSNALMRDANNDRVSG